MIAPFEAKELIFKTAPFLFGGEEVDLLAALGRTLLQPILADRDISPFNRSMMDGVAFSFDQVDQTKPLLIHRTIHAGEEVREILRPQSAYLVMTGAALPPTVDTVVPIERVSQKDGCYLLRAGEPQKGDFVHLKGADAKRGDELIPSGTKITPQVMALLASVGVTRPFVAKKNRITIFSTGDEVVSPDSSPLPTQIRDANSYQLKSLCELLGHTVTLGGILKDDQEIIESAISSAALTSDLIIFSGGVSMGKKDFLPELLKKSDFQIHFHKVCMQPGKPTLFATKGEVAVLGLPGNPVSSFVSFTILLAPLFAKERRVALPLLTAYEKNSDRFEYRSAILQTVGNKSFLQVLKNNGSGDYISFSRATHLIAFEFVDKKSFEARESVLAIELPI